MSGPLEGVVVVDCARGSAGAVSSCLLSDYGASVIHVEAPGGDPERGRSSAYAVFGRGKRSLIADLGDPRGAEIVMQLLSSADVFLESWRPGVADSFGLGYAEVHRRFPQLVYCSISGYGQDDPRRDEAGYESLVAANLGVMCQQVGIREGPIYPGFSAGMTGAALLGVIGILAALWARDDTGTGQHVDTSLVDGNLAYLAMYWQQAEKPTGELGISNDPHRRLVVGPMEASDGEYVWVHSAASGGHKQAMEVLGLADRVQPAQGPIEMAEPLTDDEAQLLATELPRIFRTLPRDEWLARFRQTDVAAVPALRPGEAFDHPQVTHNQMTTLVDDLELGVVSQVGIAAKMSESPAGAIRRAPGPGEHTESILADLGYAAEEIDGLRSEGVVQ